jgi:rhomboid protease GluP
MDELPPEVNQIPQPEVVRYPLHPVRLTYVLIAANVLIFVPTLLLGDLAYELGALRPDLVLYAGQLWRLVTAGFLHAGLTHLLFNMYALYIFGRDAERIFGTPRFAAIYGLALLGGNVLVTLLNPLSVWGVGASGAILGLLGALIAYFWKYKERVVGAREHLANLAMTAFINVAIGFLPLVSMWGHLGGVAAGLAAGLLLLPRYTVTRTPWVSVETEPFGGRELVAGGLLLLGLLAVLALAFVVR